jgi:Beta-lactamase superfamily domain
MEREMRVTFVGHASVICEVGDVSLWSDPWLKGEAFNESWALYPQPSLRDEDVARITHVWISHEHPDHLSIPTIKALPPERKARMVALFQKHYDTEVIDWLRTQGFKEVRELPHAVWIELSSRCRVACYQVGHTDSALAIRGEDRTILNLNDCDTPAVTLRRLARKMGHVDLLLDQFSIAGWCGNPEDVQRRRTAARGILDKFVRDVDCINPDYVLPFASFVRFSHEENSYMNSSVNSLDDIAAKVDRSRLLVMYPGDVWNSEQGGVGNSEVAKSKYRRNWSQVATEPLRSHETCSMEKILDAANRRIEDIRQKYQRWLLGRVPLVSFYVTDLGRAFVVDLRAGATEVQLPEAECVVSLGSQAAWYTFAMRFGLPTLGVSGRFKMNHSEPAFAALKKLGAAYSSGFYTKKAPRFGVRWRLCEFWWRRRRDVVSQFLRRVIVGATSTPRRNAFVWSRM